MITLRRSAPRPRMTCFKRSWVSGRANLTPASSCAMALASAGPIQIGSTRSPSCSWRITTNTPVVILQEQEGERVLPIWIGPAEASAIAQELAGVKFARPLTHDLLKQVILGLGADLRKVIITQVKDNTYYAELHIYRGDAVIQVDARPSDSIAVALRLKAPIFTTENLLALTSVETGEPGGESGSGPLASEALENYLQNLDPEDFGKFTPYPRAPRLS